MKKAIFVLLALVILFGMVGCDGEGGGKVCPCGCYRTNESGACVQCDPCANAPKSPGTDCGLLDALEGKCD